MPVSRVKVARVEKGFSQEELANRVEVTRQTIGMIEAGDYNPTLKLCVRIARTLGKTLDQLFWEEEK
jgi:putative transcriptional regulator